MKKILVSLLITLLFGSTLTFAQGSIDAKTQKATSLDLVIISMGMDKITKNLSYVKGYITPLENDLKIDIVRKMDLKMLEKTEIFLLILKGYCNINEELKSIEKSNDKLKKIEPFDFFTSHTDNLISNKKIEAENLKETLDSYLYNVQEQINILEIKKDTNKNRNWLERQLDTDF